MMPLGPFLIWTTAGSLIWTVALTTAGWLLGSRWNEVLVSIKPVEGVVYKVLALALLALMVWLGLRIWRRGSRT
jgi:membrane protein DedA with SNARE-associated domain